MLRFRSRWGPLVVAAFALLATPTGAAPGVDLVCVSVEAANYGRSLDAWTYAGDDEKYGVAVTTDAPLTGATLAVIVSPTSCAKSPSTPSFINPTHVLETQASTLVPVIA